MTVTVMLEQAAPRILAAVRRSVRLGEVGKAFDATGGAVWTFLAAHPGLRTDGQNIFLYHHPASRGDPMTVDFGVEVTRTFPDSGEIICTSTPAGEIAGATHVGPCHLMQSTHAAIHQWAAANGRSIGGQSWEIYGDHHDDPARLETRICYLLD